MSANTVSSTPPALCLTTLHRSDCVAKIAAAGSSATSVYDADSAATFPNCSKDGQRMPDYCRFHQQCEIPELYVTDSTL
jgi:hypothetical protein